MLELLQRCHGNYLLCEDKLEIPLQDFADCRHKYSGSVFLLASGPSAGAFPVSCYANYPFIAMNGSIARFVDEKIKPLFYICSDPSFPAARPDLAIMGCEHASHIAMALECFEEIYSHDKSVLMGKSLYLLERVNRYYNKQSVSDRRFAWSIRNNAELISNFSLLRKRPNRIGFSKNMHHGYFCARTIVYIALQLVYTLGFRKVFITGMDLSGNIGRFYEDKGKGLPTSLDDEFDKIICPSFQLVAKKIICDDFSVFNLSASSRLPDSMIPKITLKQLDCLLAQK
ncbi:MAG: hypothetical protein LBT71_03875 [Azoarcus sp.]|jgi:KDO transferase-3|nr:hypothetical protein [Azoarcus sp.]